MSSVNMSPEQLQQILEAVVSRVTRLNPLEQKKYDEDLAKERRRDMLAVQLGKAEAEAQKNKRDNCSHQRYPATAGKNAGELAPKGTAGAEWCTRGQAYQNGLALIFCTRCHSDWWFQPTQAYYTEILQNGIYGVKPPSDEHTYCIGCYNPKPQCKCAELAKENLAAHPTVA